MGLETHGRWPWIAAALVVPAWSWAAARRGELREDGAWVAWLALPILVSHQTEEWVWPDGFLPFCNTRLLGSARPDWPLTERDGFHVNVTGGWPHAAAGARWLVRSGRVSRRQELLAGAVGGAFSGLPLAMKLRMRRASRLSRDA